MASRAFFMMKCKKIRRPHIYRSLIHISEVNLQYTFIRCEIFKQA